MQERQKEESNMNELVIPEDVRATRVPSGLDNYISGYMLDNGFDVDSMKGKNKEETTKELGTWHSKALEFLKGLNFLYGDANTDTVDLGNQVVQEKSWDFESTNFEDEEDIIKLEQQKLANTKEKASQFEIKQSVKAFNFATPYLDQIPKEDRDNLLEESRGKGRSFYNVVKELQTDLGVDIDGYLGKDTVDALNERASNSKRKTSEPKMYTKEAVEESKGFTADTRKLQEYAGMPENKIDGSPGPTTAQYLRNKGHTDKEIVKSFYDLYKPKEYVFAAGKYQMIPAVVSDAVSKLDWLTEDTKFTKETQDKIVKDYIIPIKRKPMQDYIDNKKGATLEKALDAASKEWASIKGAGGKGYYSGQRAHTDISKELKIARDTGNMEPLLAKISSGESSSYNDYNKGSFKINRNGKEIIVPKSSDASKRHTLTDMTIKEIKDYYKK
jgi:hypothetical protein